MICIKDLSCPNARLQKMRMVFKRLDSRQRLGAGKAEVLALTSGLVSE
jgi:hypothetical protein